MSFLLFYFASGTRYSTLLLPLPGKVLLLPLPLFALRQLTQLRLLFVCV
jgi:hypothetical protein